MPEQRRRLVLEMLRERRGISVATLEDLFGVSSMTARRYLAILAREGHARRTHGGAVLPDMAAHEDSFRNRLELEVAEKQRLARAVVASLAAGETLFIVSSTTGWYVAQAILAGSLNLTVLTNSQPIMSLIGNSDAPTVELVALGGSFRQLTHSFVGPDVTRALGGFLVDRLLFSVKGISAEGYLTDAEPLEAEVKRGMIAHAASVALLATPHKLSDSGRTVVGEIRDVDIVYLADARTDGARALESLDAVVRRV